LTLQRPSADVDGLSALLFNATVDPNPRQIDAALFALEFDEVGLVLCQLWAERRRR
jgi:hypothetical protein